MLSREAPAVDPYTEVTTEVAVGQTAETPKVDALADVAFGARAPMNVNAPLSRGAVYRVTFAGRRGSKFTEL